MIMRLNIYIQRLSKFTNNPADYIYNILKGSENYVLAIPRRRLSVSGTDANDKLIEPEYAATTIKNKERKGQSTRVVNLKDTDQLRQSFKLVKEGNSVDFIAPISEKTIFLTEHYSGNDLFGFSPKDGKEIARIFIEPELQKLVNEIDGIDISF